MEAGRQATFMVGRRSIWVGPWAVVLEAGQGLQGLLIPRVPWHSSGMVVPANLANLGLPFFCGRLKEEAVRVSASSPLGWCLMKGQKRSLTMV